MNRLPAFSLAALMGLAVAAGCSNGGAGKIDPIPAAPPQSSLAQFTITVPTSSSSTSASTRKPQFEVPGGTQSVTIQLTSANGTTQSGQVVTVNLSSSNSACSTSNGNLTCTVTVPGISGSDVFTVISYSQPNAQGTVIAKGTASVTTTSGQTTTVPVTLSGSVASIAISFGGIALNGMSRTVPVIVNVKDASGATIMGTYDKPVTLANSDTSGVTKLSTMTLNDSTAAAGVTLSYNGGALANGAVISATASGVPSSSITNGTFTLNGDYATNNGMVLTYNVSATSSGNPFSTGHTISYAYTDTYTTGVTYNGQSNLLKVHYAPSGSSTYAGTNVMDYYYQFAPAGTSGGNINELAWTQTPQNPASGCSTATVASSPWLIAELPFKAANAWDSSGSYVETWACVYNGSTSETETYKFNKDGSYDDQGTYSGEQYSYHDVLNSDGSGTEQNVESSGTYTTVIGTPQPAPTGTPGSVIAITQSFVPASPDPSASPTPAPTPTYVPDWIPGGKVPSPLQSDTTVDKGSVSIPSSCNVASTIATTAEQFENTYSDIDTLFGDVDNATNEFYFAPNVGLVCATYSDTYSWYNIRTGQRSGGNTWNSTETLTSVSPSPLSSARTAQSIAQGPAFMTVISQHLQRQQQLMQERHAAARAKMVKSQLRKHA